MKKFLIITTLILAVGCNKKDTEAIFTETKNAEPIKVEDNSITITSNISVLRNDNNSKGLFFINGVLKDKNQTVKIIFPENVNEKDYIINTAFPMNNAFGISIMPLKKDTAVHPFTIEAVDEKNNVFYKENIYMFTLKKLYPVSQDANFTPLDDENVIIFNNNHKENYIVLNQVEDENHTVLENNSYNSQVQSGYMPITEYGFDNKLFNGSVKVNSSNGFTVNKSEKEFIVNNNTFPNCINTSTFHGVYPCALKITHNGDKKQEAVFYLRLNKNYIDTSIKLKVE